MALLIGNDSIAAMKAVGKETGSQKIELTGKLISKYIIPMLNDAHTRLNVEPLCLMDNKHVDVVEGVVDVITNSAVSINNNKKSIKDYKFLTYSLVIKNARPEICLGQATLDEIKETVSGIHEGLALGEHVCNVLNTGNLLPALTLFALVPTTEHAFKESRFECYLYSIGLDDKVDLSAVMKDLVKTTFMIV